MLFCHPEAVVERRFRWNYGTKLICHCGASNVGHAATAQSALAEPQIARIKCVGSWLTMQRPSELPPKRIHHREGSRLDRLIQRSVTGVDPRTCHERRCGVLRQLVLGELQRPEVRLRPFHRMCNFGQDSPTQDL